MENGEKLKTQVRDFWDEKSCGEIYAAGESEREYYDTHEPYLPEFARFQEGKDQDVLEIGVGMGADHVEWAKSQPKSLTGIDLTPRAIEHTSKRLKVYGLKSDVRVGDAEKLPFADDSFDLIYSWGVLHHSPDTPRAIREVHRVLRPGGRARIMIYHRYSLTGYMLWLRYGLMTGHPFRPLNDIYARYLESPGTKAYTTAEARAMFADFGQSDVRIQLNFGDLLEGSVGQRHQGALLSIAKKLWPRWLLLRLFKNHGLYLLIEARK